MRALGIISRLDQVFDSPHAVKEVLTGQSGLANSGGWKGSRVFWNNLCRHFQLHLKVKQIETMSKGNWSNILLATTCSTMRSSRVGFRSSLVFKFVSNSVAESLPEEQQNRIGKLEAETKHEERKIEEAMASIQESMAAPPMFHLVQLVRRLVDGQVLDLDAAMEELRAAMLMVMEKADNLLGMTVWEVCEILSPEQTVKLFAGAAHFHLQTRRMGLHMKNFRFDPKL
jgi:hypothetical protein